MPEYSLKYADTRGEMRQQVVEASSEGELRQRMTDQGFLVYSVKERTGVAALGGRRKRKLDMEKFLIFNQQFVTLFRAGLPILKALDLLADRLTDKKLGPHVREIRDDVKRGTLLSEAFRRQGIFPAIYVTSIMAGEKSGALGEVMERYISYQKLALAVRKKILLSLMYPAILLVLVSLLIVFLITFVVPRFAELYGTTNTQLPIMTRWLIAIGTTAQSYVLFAGAALVAGIVALRYYLKTEAGQSAADRLKMKTPVL
ncbi:MAG TPA: type II secretion system F family protein, partial [Bryobacteraceae bacterium]|nr:type II secretion system F family protein [Bryobacteraceae bacterium]